jgi:hypothetical protein
MEIQQMPEKPRKMAGNSASLGVSRRPAPVSHASPFEGSALVENNQNLRRQAARCDRRPDSKSLPSRFFPRINNPSIKG